MRSRDESLFGKIINIMNPVRTMNFERKNRIVKGHKTTVQYTYVVRV